jgi:3-oxoacyl-(acyl-carrier-protein) synthase
VKPIYVTGVGLWSPGFANVAAFRDGTPDPDVVKPPCELVNARLGRGSSRFGKMLGEVVEQAATDAGADVTKVATVYGSSLGEIETMVTLLRMLYEEEGKLSPNRFKNSVHNAASGLVSIGTGNTGFSTAIAGGDRSFEVSLLEAWALLEERGGHVVLAVADDEPPEPLDRLDEQGALALAFCLSAEPAGARAELSDLRAAEAPEAHARIPEELRGNCAAAGLELLDAVLEGRAGSVSVAPPGRSGMVIDVEPA